MAQMQNAQSVALQLEKVRDKLPLLYERDDILLTMIQQRGDVERVSSRNMRLPLQIRPGGKAGLANMDGGDLGRGSGTVYDVAQVPPVFFRHAVEITKLVEYASNAPDKAVENAAKREVKNAMAQFRAFLDKVMQTNGNGVLGTISSVTTSGLPSGVAAQFAMAKPPGAQLFYYNQTVQVYDSNAFTTNRGSANVLLVDPFNSLIQVDALPSGTVATDVVVHDGTSPAQSARFALRHSLPPDQRHHGHVAQPQPRDVSGRARDAQRERQQSCRLRLAPCASQSTKCASHSARIRFRSWWPTRRSSRSTSGSSSASPFRKSSRKERVAARAISTCSSPATKRWRVCPSSRASTQISRAWISSICRTGAER